MSERQFSRRRLLSIFGYGALSLGAASMLSTSPLSAATERLPAWLFGTRNLSKEVQWLRTLLAQRNHPDFSTGSAVGGYAPGKRLDWYINEKSRRCEALFGVPARCESDVLRKYAMFEEMDWRSFRHSVVRFPSSKEQHRKLFGHWYAQLEEDAQKYSIDIGPWWRDGTRSFAMIDGKHVVWAEDHWELYNPPQKVRAALEKIRGKKFVPGEVVDRRSSPPRG